MSDKPIAGLVAAIAIAPLCAFCVLGPAALGSVAAWIAGWLGGFDLWTTISAAVVAAALVYGMMRWRRARALGIFRGERIG